jgi:SpoVK/Ycf46/Vps4 family AAA+-type ATPase
MLEAVLPFACDRERLFDLPRGVLVFGNRGVGKTLLALATINALGATFLNFSPAVLIGKETPSPRILMLMVIKAARILAPSVILVDDIHRMFGKGRKITDSSKKFKAQLRRQIRKIKPRDRILFLATTSAPLPKPCTTLFNRAIEIPKPDFPTRAAIWEFWLRKKGLLIPTVSVNALTFASEGYTGGSIARCCVKGARVKMSRTEPNDPITDEEILNFLADAPEEESKPHVDLMFGGYIWIRPIPLASKKS